MNNERKGWMERNALTWLFVWCVSIDLKRESKMRINFKNKSKKMSPNKIDNSIHPTTTNEQILQTPNFRQQHFSSLKITENRRNPSRPPVHPTPVAHRHRFIGIKFEQIKFSLHKKFKFPLSRSPRCYTARSGSSQLPMVGKLSSSSHSQTVVWRQRQRHTVGFFFLVSEPTRRVKVSYVRVQINTEVKW